LETIAKNYTYYDMNVIQPTMWVPPPPSNQPFFAFALPTINAHPLCRVYFIRHRRHQLRGIKFLADTDLSENSSCNAYTRECKYCSSWSSGHRKNN